MLNQGRNGFLLDFRYYPPSIHILFLNCDGSHSYSRTDWDHDDGGSRHLDWEKFAAFPELFEVATEIVILLVTVV